MVKKHYSYWLIGIIILSAILNFYHLGTPVLYTDEAEVYLAAQNIFSSGVPKGFYKTPFYENAYFFESNASMYEFAPTNYYKSEVVLKKGWFTYYLVAFFSLFGKSEFLLRFPFALIGLISLFVLYKLTEIMFNSKTALITSFLYAVSPSILFYDRMIRYYSPMILFCLLSVYFFFKAFDKGDKKDYVFGTLSLILLFYTNVLIFGSLIIVIGIYGLIKKIKIDKTIIQSIIILIIGMIPWIISTDFLRNIFVGEPRNNILLLKLKFVLQTITAGINTQGLLFIILLISIVLLLINIFMKKIPKLILWKEKDSNKFLLIYICIMIIIPSILSPQSSFEEKLFVSLIPFFFILIAKTFDSILNIFENKTFKYVVVVVILVACFVNIGSVVGYQNHNSITPKEIFNLEKNNVFEKIDEVIKNQGMDDPLILTTADQFPLMFYTNYSAQTIWPVKKSFIDNYDKPLIIIEKSFVDGNCGFFYQYLNPVMRCGNNKNYLDKIKDCDLFALDKDLKLYFCKEKKKFIGGNQGLFFYDFPKGYPPDFIWDLEPFPVSVDINNLGDFDVDNLKVKFTGDFAGNEFDIIKNEFEFNKTISSQKKDLGAIITQSENFYLGVVKFNHKLLNRNKYVNVSVKICYPYQTIIRVDMCEDSLKMCGLDISGAPVQIENIKYNDLDLNFSIYNSADGIIGDVNECDKINATKKIGITSAYFKCDPNKTSFACEGVKNRLEKGNSYYITIIYDYQQEFKKALLLRSKEKNLNDYELSHKNS